MQYFVSFFFYKMTVHVFLTTWVVCKIRHRDRQLIPVWRHHRFMTCAIPIQVSLQLEILLCSIPGKSGQQSAIQIRWLFTILWLIFAYVSHTNNLKVITRKQFSYDRGLRTSKTITPLAQTESWKHHEYASHVHITYTHNFFIFL